MNNNNNNNIWKQLSTDKYSIIKQNLNEISRPIYKEIDNNFIENNFNNLKDTNSSLLNKKTNREKPSNNNGLDLDKTNLLELTFAKDKQKRNRRENFHDDLIKIITDGFNEIQRKKPNEEILSGLETIVDHTKRIIIRNRKVDILENKELIDLCNYVITLIENIEKMPNFPMYLYEKIDNIILEKIFELEAKLEPNKMNETNSNTISEDTNNEAVYFPEELESFLQEDSDYFKNLPQNLDNTIHYAFAMGANIRPKMFAKFFKDFSKLTKNYFPSGKSTKGRSPEEKSSYNTMHDALSYTKDLYRYLNDKGYIDKSGDLIDTQDGTLSAKIQKHKERLYEPLKALYTALGLKIEPFSFYK